MHLTEVAPVTQIRPLRPVAAAVQTSSGVKTAELQTQFVDLTCSCWASWAQLAQLMLERRWYLPQVNGCVYLR